ncbi:hypothetical protein AGMMS49525_07840 [Bacteroidia bacterium]|nr:hypothetical protein AGMMS49525_07840 [Bacteroidia bacterium]
MKKSDFNYAIANHEKFFYSHLSERDKRLYAGLEAMKAGYYGVEEVSKKYGIHKHTVRRGKKELLLEIVPEAKKVRQKGGGRKKTALKSNRWSQLLSATNHHNT